MAKFLAYTFSGLMCAVAGIAQAAQETQGDPEAGAGYELTAIAMVVIGGTSLAGGRGSMGLTLLGILHHRLLAEDPQHQCGPGSWPAHDHRDHHRARRPDAEAADEVTQRKGGGRQDMRS